MQSEYPDDHVFRSTQFPGVIKDGITFFQSTSICDLPPNFDFAGSGVYGLYYQGDFPLYSKLVEKSGSDFKIPIYIGKAVPQGWRTNRVRDTTKSVLKERLRQHSRTINQAQNLKIDDFKCRFVILNGIEGDLITALEAALIRHYSPLWNSGLDGFGDHDPGNKRYEGIHPEWDTVHPGRIWATRMRGEKRDLDSINKKILNHLDRL
jgi:hypothetical protein